MPSTTYISPNLDFARCACLTTFNPGNLLFALASYELGNVFISDGATYLISTSSTSIPYLFSSEVYTLFNGTLPNNSSVFGGTGVVNWVPIAYTGNEGLQFSINNGGIYSNIQPLVGLNYQVVGTEIFTAFIQMLNVPPDEILLYFYSNGAWHAIYWGTTEQFAPHIGVVPINVGAVPLQTGQWVGLTFTPQDLGLVAGNIITGLGWGIYKSSGNSTVVFSNIQSSVQPSPMTITGGFLDATSDNVTGFYLLESPNLLVHFLEFNQSPVLINLPNTSPSYTALTTNNTSGITYILGTDGQVYEYQSGVVSSLAAAPSGVTTPARSLYYSYPNLFTLFPNSNDLAVLNLNSLTWSLSASPFTNSLDQLTVTNQIVVGGSDPISFSSTHNNDMTYNVNSSQLLIVDTSNNQIRIYNFESSTWTLNTTVSGAGTPTVVVTNPPSTQAFVCNPTDNVVQILSYNLGVWTSSNLSITDPVDIAVTPNGTQAIVCNESANTVSILVLSAGTWSIAYTLSITAPTSVAITPDGLSACVGTSTGVTFLTYNGTDWVIASTITLSHAVAQVQVDTVNPRNLNFYVVAADTVSHVLFYVFNQQQLVTLLNPSSFATFLVVNYQLFYFTAGTVINANTFVDGIYTSIVTLTPVGPAGTTSSVFITNPTDFTNLILVGGSSSVYEYYNDKPLSLVRTADALVAVLSGASWITTDLQNRNRISSLTADPSGNIFAAIADNENNIYKVANSAIVNGYPYQVPDPTGQLQETIIGLSKLVFALNQLYSASSLYGSLIVMSNL